MTTITSGVQFSGGVIFGPATADELYAFTAFTFTNANTVGNIGPTLSNCTSTYDTVTYPWLTDTSYFNMLTQGYQLWTAPKTGTYRIRAAGASAGYKRAAPYTASQITAGYCNGAVIEVGNVSLTKGQKLQIVVGQQGGTYANVSGGGGGATWVCNYTGNTNTLGDFLMVAGGGGSVNQQATGNIATNTWGANSNAGYTTTANVGYIVGGAAGNLTIVSGNTYPYTGGRNTTWTAGGGGWYADGANSTNSAGGRGGQSFLNGLRGGGSNPTTGGLTSAAFCACGGFGGGGGSHGNSGGGGGGAGWTGGGGGQQTNANDVGGGGSSYSQLPNTPIGQNRGHGYCIITYVG